MRALLSPPWRAWGAALAAVAALLTTATFAAPAAASGTTGESGGTATAAATTIAVSGHGWGHGRGMGQYGAYGYTSMDGWTSAQILDHFYGGTTPGDVGDPVLTVRMVEHDGQSTVVNLDQGQLSTMDSAGNVTPAPDRAVKVDQTGAGTWQISDGPGCGGPWTPRAGVVSSALIRILPEVADPSQTDPSQALQLCGSGTDVRWVRGNVLATQSNGAQYTVNELTMDSYLRGVVPRESPASWPAAALEAQAVAARSYGYAEDRYPYAKTCNTTSCQVYGGWQMRVSGTVTPLEYPSSNLAVGATTGKVRVRDGNVMRTEFSSSTGGWTAGGTFPSVADDGDAISANPNHDWTTGVPVSAIEGAYNKGSLQRIDILARSTSDGGRRVATLRLTFSGGTVDVSGSDFQGKFGLKSTWFDIRSTPVARGITNACPDASQQQHFSDVPPGADHQPAIDCVAWWQVAQGTADGRYLPGYPVTRAQMASFIANEITKAGGSLPSDPPDAFADDNGDVHEHAINQLAAVGVVSGKSAGVFDPNGLVTRGQMAKFLGGAWKQLVGSSLTSTTDWFGDDDGSPFEGDINNLASAGIATGYGDGTYRPNTTVNRAQMAEFLARLLDKEVAEGHAQLPG